MADTVRTVAALQVLLADNVGGDISAQDIRDFLVSCVLKDSDGNVHVLSESKLYFVDTGNYGAYITNNNNTPHMDLELYGVGLDSSWEGRIKFYTSDHTAVGDARMIIDELGQIGIGTLTPTVLLDVNADSIRIRTSQSPASGGAGIQGEIAWDATYLYVCVATNEWERVELTGSY